MVPSPMMLGVAFLVPAWTGITLAVGAVLWGLVRTLTRGRKQHELTLGAAGLIAGEAVLGMVWALVAGVRM
jgi:uncharacterized oligopeptide transporter (OPT) family protein